MEHRHSIENNQFRMSTCACTKNKIITFVDKDKKKITFISSERLLELIRGTNN